MKAQHDPQHGGAEGDLASLLGACGRDERPALEALYRRTAARLYGRAAAATTSPDQADHALLQTYLSAFAEAARFDRAVDDPTVWLERILGRHLPAPTSDWMRRSTRPAPLEPPAELWHRLDIAVGLKRLDRHIKPGVATQQRGRDPMPNAFDRRIERQLRFWRAAGVSSFLAFAAAATVIGAAVWQGGPLAPLVPTTGSLTVARAAVPPSGPARLAILRAADEGRVWRVDFEDDTLRVQPLPPFSRPDGKRPGVLTLWAAGGDPEHTLVRLADLDPARTTGIDLPDGLAKADLDTDGIELVISLEPAGAEATAKPSGPVLFSGRFQP